MVEKACGSVPHDVEPDRDETKVAILEAQVRDLQSILHQNDFNIQVAFLLSRSLANILGLLIASPIVTTEMIQQRLEIVTEGRVAMHRLRKAMKEHGIEIRSKRHLGYWLDPETKRTIRERLAKTDEELAGQTKAPTA